MINWETRSAINFHEHPILTTLPNRQQDCKAFLHTFVHAWAVVALRLDSELTVMLAMLAGTAKRELPRELAKRELAKRELAKRERERQTKPRAFITGLLTRERKTETKTGVQGETETKTFCLNYPRVDHLSRLSRVPGEITGQHKDSNLLFCIVTCYCDNMAI